MADRTVKVNLRGDVSDFNRAMLTASAGAKAFAAGLGTTNDRMSNLTQTALALGPALVPVGAVAVPAVAGLTNQLAFAAAGAGVAAVAFSGVGDALKAVNDFGVEPTDANLKKMSQTLSEIGPAGREFVFFLQELRAPLQELQNTAQAGIFPGLQAGMTDLMTLLPQVERIVDVIANSLGDIAAEAGAELAGPGWQEFFGFLEREARPTLIQMAQTMGNFAKGFADLWMAFDPLTDQFSAGFLQMSRDFASWADGLSQTQGFQDFLAYIADVGPQVSDTLGAFGNLLLQVLEATAPVGAAALAVLEPLFDVIAAIANTPIGTTLIAMAAGLAAVSRSMALFQATGASPLATLLRGDFRGAATGITAVGAAAQKSKIPLTDLRDQANKTGTAFARSAKLAGGAAGLAFVMSDLDDKMGLTNTASLALMGTLAGPWGAAIGAGVGLALDFAAANDDVWQAIDQANTVMGNAGASVSQINSAYTAAARSVEDYAASVEGAARNEFSLASAKNALEGLFGRSDVEEARSALEDLERTRTAAIARAREQQFAEFGLTDAMTGASEATRSQTAALLENISAKNSAADAALNAFDAETRYRNALLEARKAAGDNNAGIRENTAAANANREIISNLTSSWNAFADSGQASQKQFGRAKDQLLDFARSVGVPKRELRALADAMHLPTPKTPKIDVNTHIAAGKIKNVAQLMQSTSRIQAKPKIDVQSNADKAAAAARRAIASVKSKKVYIDTIFRRRRNTSANPTHNADGGYIRGPGGPRDDAIPAWLSNGEYVINAAATKQFLPLLEKINAKKFADGGQALTPLTPFPTIDTSGGLAGPTTATFDQRDLARAVTAGLEGATFKLDKDNRTLTLATKRG